MSNFVGISDPVCLELPELGLCGDGCPTPVAPEDCCVRRRPPVVAPCVSLAVALHGALFFLALTMAMGVGAPRPVIGISLLPARGSGMLDRAGGQPGSFPEQVAAGWPAATRRGDPVAATDGVQEPATSEAAARKSAKVRVVPEKTRTETPAATRPRTTPRKPMARSQVPAASASASSEQDQDAAKETPDAKGQSSDTGLQARHAGSTGVAAAVPPGASGTFGVMGGQGLRGSRRDDGPVGATFGDADGPSFVRRVMPRYPELARRRGREGLVLLRLVIGPGGELRDAQVVEGGGHGFDEAALIAVRASVYAPAMREGRGVECAVLLPIRFALKGS